MRLGRRKKVCRRRKAHMGGIFNLLFFSLFLFPMFPAMKFPREVLDRVSFFTPTLSRDNLFDSLRLRPWKSDRQQMSLWSNIFRNDEWLEEVTDKGHARLVLIGPQLSQVVPRSEQECYMTLCLLDGTGNIPPWELFESSLHEHTYEVSSREIHFTSGIILNVHSLYPHTLRNDQELRELALIMTSPERMKQICSSHKGKPRTQYSFYGRGYIQNLSFSNITEIGGRVCEFVLRDDGIASTVIVTSMCYNLLQGGHF